MRNSSGASSVKKLSSSINAAMEIYHIGDKDIRPWGHYIVTGIGIVANDKWYCEKIITVKSGKVLSLQSHNQRRETWTVKKGILTALCDGKRMELFSNNYIHIPMGSIHCMANLGEEDCIVEERQEGICCEEDIKRYMDAYNRSTEKLVTTEATESLTAYIAILKEIKNMQVKRA